MRTLAILITLFLVGTLISFGKMGLMLDSDYTADDSDVASQAASGEYAHGFGWYMEEASPGTEESDRELPEEPQPSFEIYKI